jgi:hypothetical protein
MKIMGVKGDKKEDNKGLKGFKDILDKIEEYSKKFGASARFRKINL